MLSCAAGRLTRPCRRPARSDFDVGRQLASSRGAWCLAIAHLSNEAILLRVRRRNCQRTGSARFT